MNELQATIRILCDHRHWDVADAIYLYAQTIDNERSVLEAAGSALKENLTKRVLISAAAKSAGYPGFQNWKKKLTGHGISDALIFGITLEPGILHNTLTEAAALVQHAKICRYESVYICAPPFHQLRAFMTTVGVAIRKYPVLKIYNYSGLPLPWDETVTHSQGALRASRSLLIDSELHRIDKYTAKGDLIPFETVLEFLDRRDAQRQS